MDGEKAAVKIKSYSVGFSGRRGFVLTLPRVWLNDLDLQPGDKLDVFRDTQDRLIIQKAIRASA
jgi:hypothetical protein